MKAHIGPYVNRWRSDVHTNYMNKKYGYFEWSDSNTRFEKSLEWLEDRLQSLYNLTINKYLDKKERKIKVRIDNYDVWNADHTIALIVHPILLKLKERKRGTPLVDDDDVPEHLRSTAAPSKDEDWDLDDNHEARWDYVLDEMIWAFEQCTKDDKGDDQFCSGEVDLAFEKDEATGNSKMSLGPNHTFKVDKEGQKAHYDRINNGLRLFGKYYMALWD